ncbi:MAG TPA: response regulator [Spirochaetia bacterium]|nr:response regulator [Spirochaetia bacterium]
MPSTQKQRVFSALEVAKICGVVNQTVINWIRAGHLKASVTPGGQFRIYPDDLKTFLDSKGMRVPEELQALVVSEEPSILVVEDDRVYNELLRAQLQRAFPSAKLLAAFDGFEAGSSLGVQKPRVVVLDLNLPGVNGLELCRRIKDEPGFDRPIIIGITASDDPSLEGQLLALGADAFFRKPFDVEALVSVIRSTTKW